MIKTPLSTVIGGAFWTHGCTVVGSAVVGSTTNLDGQIAKLFSNGEQGFFYDPNDLSTMWQDQAKLLPVTGAGQPVWHILDKSGNNNHAFATSSASRPILQRNATTGAYYLAFDGADDFLQTNSIDFTATDKMSLFAGIKSVLTLNTYQALMELSASFASNNGTFLLTSPQGSADTIAFVSKGNAYSGNKLSLIQGAERIISTQSSISSDVNKLKVNGSMRSISSDQGTGNYGNHPLYIGSRSGTTLKFEGHIYGLIGVGRLTSNSETIALEQSIAKNVGVTLNV